MKSALVGACISASLIAAGPLSAAESANALRQTSHPDQHPERTMHRGVAEVAAAEFEHRVLLEDRRR